MHLICFRIHVLFNAGHVWFNSAIVKACCLSSHIQLNHSFLLFLARLDYRDGIGLRLVVPGEGLADEVGHQLHRRVNVLHSPDFSAIEELHRRLKRR